MLEFHGRALQEVEQIIEKREKLADFEHGVTDLARALKKRDWQQYAGEDIQRLTFGGDVFSLAAAACCVCGRMIGFLGAEEGFGYWSGTNGELRFICCDDLRRWQRDNLEPA